MIWVGIVRLWILRVEWLGFQHDTEVEHVKHSSTAGVCFGFVG